MYRGNKLRDGSQPEMPVAVQNKTHTIQRIYHSVGEEMAYVTTVGFHLQTSQEHEERNFLTLHHQVPKSQELFIHCGEPSVKQSDKNYRTNLSEPIAYSCGELSNWIQVPFLLIYLLHFLFSLNFLPSLSHFLKFYFFFLLSSLSPSSVISFSF